MERVNKPVCIVLFLCSAVMACKREDPFSDGLGDKRHTMARLAGEQWRPCCDKPQIRTSCPDPIGSREQALDLLGVAGGECLDRVLRKIEQQWPEYRSAAYLIRAERNGDPLDLLPALEHAKGFNRALALERLGLIDEAIEAWEAASRESSGWSEEARRNRDRLRHLPDPTARLGEPLIESFTRRDLAALTGIARTFPAETTVYFERFALKDLEGARVLAAALAAVGEHYPQAVIEAIPRARSRQALEQGIAALGAGNYSRAAALLERTENPLYVGALSHAANRASTPAEQLKMLDRAATRSRPEWTTLSSRIQANRGFALESLDHYFQAHAAYELALAASTDPSSRAAALARRSQNYTVMGSAALGFRDAYEALSTLDRVASVNPRHNTYGAAAMAARALNYPRIALLYQNAAVAVAEKSVPRHLPVALRGRADLHVELGNDAEAEADLAEASARTETATNPVQRELLQMRVHEVRGQALLAKDPRAAIGEFSKAIQLASRQDSTYRAVLHFKRAAARHNAGDLRAADEDLATALHIVREEGRSLVATGRRGEYEDLWMPYFARFQDMHHRIIESHIAANRIEEAFVYADLARALEPMQLLLQSPSAPPGFRPIETAGDLRRYRTSLPDDTVVLQYLVLPNKTYSWALTSDTIELHQHRAGSAEVEELVGDALDAVKKYRQSGPFTNAMREAYAELFQQPLQGAAAAAKTRIVIVPDGPMHGFPFAALQGTEPDGHLIERASIATAASTSLYLYALRRDAQFAGQNNPSVLLVGDPAFDPKIKRSRLGYARAEVEELARDHYPGAEILVGAEATVPAFLSKAKNAGIIHFAGHGIVNSQGPWQSRLLLAAQGDDSGELTAETLMKELSGLERTRLVVLGACSTAGGHPVGPQGLASLVRPLIAANVPAVVGALWDVEDATTKELLVSFHCHYRHGDDVAVALQHAQREMLRNNEPAMAWAAFQVTGYAASPYARPAALEETRCERVCASHSLHRPHGLRPQ